MSNFNLEEQIRVLLNTVQLSYGFEQVPDVIEDTATKTASYGSVYYCLKAMNGDAVIEVARGINNNIVLSNYTIKDGDEFKCNLKSVKLTSGNVIAYKKQSGYKEVPSADVAPENVTAPIVTGTAVVGETLTTTDGTWTGTPEPTFSYQWYRGAIPISGATNSTYTLVQADAGNTSNIKCVVTATNSAGSASADSNTVAQIMDANAQAYMQAVSITNNSTVYFASTAQERTGAQLYSYYNTFYIGLKNNSLFSKISLAYRERWGVANSNRVNMINPATFLMTYSGTLTYNITGTAGNGTNGIGNTGFIPNSNGLTVNNNHIALYSRTAAANPGSTQFYECGSGTSSVVSAISTRRSSNLALYDSGDFLTNRSSYTSSDGSGIFIGKVNSDLTSKFFRNGTQVATKSITNGASLSNFAHYIHAFNENNTNVYYSPKEIAYYSMGLGLSDAEVTTYNNLIAQLNTDEGI